VTKKSRLDNRLLVSASSFAVFLFSGIEKLLCGADLLGMSRWRESPNALYFRLQRLHFSSIYMQDGQNLYRLAGVFDRYLFLFSKRAALGAREVA
jgi:hypothetical protein